MKEIIVTTQAEWDALPKSFPEYTRIIIRDTKGVRISIAELWENASAELRGNASAELRGNASAELRENASAVLWENASAVLWGNASAELWGNASAVLRGNASAELRENAVGRIFSASVRVALFGFAVAFLPAAITLKVAIEKKSQHCHIQVVSDLGWFENNGVEKTEFIVIYKRVSADWKTQEGTANETLWAVGTTVTHPKWKPDSGECGEGKFHACSRPYFCDQFRNNRGDHYIALRVASVDLREWPHPEYPHKIAFREGIVLRECDKFGKEIKSKEATHAAD